MMRANHIVERQQMLLDDSPLVTVSMPDMHRREK